MHKTQLPTNTSSDENFM